MAHASQSILRAQPRGAARRRIRVALFAGVAALPLLSMGVTVPSAVAKRRAIAERSIMRERLAERETIALSLREYSSDEAFAELEALHQGLLELIPMHVEALDEFGTLRAAAEACDVELVGVRAIRTHATSSGGSAPSGSVVIDEVLVTMSEPVDAVLKLIDELRRRGLPTLILSFDFAREVPSQRAFQAELRIGFVRRAAPVFAGESRQVP